MEIIFNPTEFRAQILNPYTGQPWFSTPPSDETLTMFSVLAKDALPIGFLDKIDEGEPGLGLRTLYNATAHVVTQFALANPVGGGGGNYNINAEGTGSVTTNYAVPPMTEMTAWWSTSLFGQLVLQQFNRMRTNRFVGGGGINWGSVAR